MFSYLIIEFKRLFTENGDSFLCLYFLYHTIKKFNLSSIFLLFYPLVKLFFLFLHVFIVFQVWPQIVVCFLSPLESPLLNTILLFLSGFFLTRSHHFIVLGDRLQALFFLLLTIVLGLMFSFLQFIKYYVTPEYFHKFLNEHYGVFFCNYVGKPFIMVEQVYSSTLYFSTEFYLFHLFVFFGTCSLIVAYFSLPPDPGPLTREQQFEFEASVWFWHFVDVVWLFLYIVFYLWDSF